MRSFRHIGAALRIFHGPDGLDRIAGELERLGAHRAVIFCGSSMARAGSPLEAVRAALGRRCAGVYGGVRVHSPLPSVEAGAGELERLAADAVVALGGGSAMVTARAASILLAEKRNARDLCTVLDENGEMRSPRLAAPKLPQFVVPTTPTTAIVKAGSAVFDPASGERLAFFDPKTRAHSIFIHPAAASSAPDALVVSAGLDTLVLAIEGLTARRGDLLSDALLKQSVRILQTRLAGHPRETDPSFHGDLILAAIMCGEGTDHTGAGIATALGHAIGAKTAVENGISKMILLPHSLRFNGEFIKTGLDKITHALGLRCPPDDPLDAVFDQIREIAHKLAIPQRLRDVGLSRETLPQIAASAMADWWLRDNPRPVRDAPELLRILEDAW
ncbi:iron-containing alcohol dehydrogenase family protein [Bradyrhizobium elkanii]|uniref:iron-containing alcohol dehydrogenase family protein n=1 Tax=Bradyrhizobium elkanii TaxID=29448 RepID=UPI00209FA8F0|nr:iron-containing alcohol dehydrogenase family protein [Bradyrhizobium elkanii]MCP1968225.1 alcohol dehydrogenase class IV [Bradyrhizobium elkanii]MCS4110274.1 alcohol dehydrogenase class IV [Bradyrhizobium elkanii]